MKFSLVSILENRRENLKLNVVYVAVLVLESNSNNTENTTTPNIDGPLMSTMIQQK